MNLELMKNLCNLTPDKLYHVLVKFLHKKGYKKIFRQAKYIFAEGDLPIAVVAHIDTVFSYVPEIEEFFYDAEKHMLWAPYGSGFDDRAGIYSIIQMIEMGYRPHVIFTDGEEKGGIGAHALVSDHPTCPFKDCKMIIQLDRANEKDAVFYNCDNDEFTAMIESYGFDFDLGTFSDISILAPHWKIAAVNLSVGYLDEHSYVERLMCDWCDATIDKVCDILNDIDTFPHYEYIEKVHYYYHGKYGKHNIYNFNPCDTTGAEENNTSFCCVICGKPINSYKEARFYTMDGFNYCICRDCEETYGGADTYETPKDDEPLPFD